MHGGKIMATANRPRGSRLSGHCCKNNSTTVRCLKETKGGKKNKNKIKQNENAVEKQVRQKSEENF